MKQLFLGIDVGTGSARAGIFDATGKMYGTATKPIKMWRYDSVFVEQSSADIWQACCGATRQALTNSGVEPKQIAGIGFDATCSLVVLDKNDQPVTVSRSQNDEQNVVVWMDHRAIAEAEAINNTKHKVLDYVGGTISPEMQTPKLLWLKKNMPQTWGRAAHFFDLPDFLVYRATGHNVRSLCSTVCKWTYLGHLQTWDDSYFNQIGLNDLVTENYIRIGQTIRPSGETVGNGLSIVAANELGLLPNTPVATGIIDAHAGGIGLLGATIEIGNANQQVEKRLALITGTSTCHMAVSPKPNFVPGVWGPYYSAMVPEMWLAEGGQSATGSLVDHVIYSHSKSSELLAQAEAENTTVYEVLNSRLAKLSDTPTFLTKDLHVLPYFHGNRSPRANPNLHGMISGLKLSNTVDDLALLYLATIQSIAYGTRHIIETMNSNGFAIDTIFACGGGTHNPLLLSEHANITGCPIVLPKESEAVLLGAAISGAVAAKQFPSLIAAMRVMNKADKIIQPSTVANLAKYHSNKYEVFLTMYEDQLKYNKLMAK